MKLFTILTTAAALAVSQAHAAGVTADASADILAALVLTNPTPLSFGTFSTDGSAGTIDSTGEGSFGIQSITSGSNASFHVVGEPGVNYTINGDPSVTLDDAGPGNPMTATLTYPAPNTRPLTGGVDDFEVSGVLAVGTNQASGHYTGSYNVSVNY